MPQRSLFGRDLHLCGALACGADDFRLIDNAGLEHVVEGRILQLGAQVVRDRLTPGVSTAMSSSIALRRSPKPGAFTAATFRPPRSLLTTRVARASPSMSSAMISRGLPAEQPPQGWAAAPAAMRASSVDQDIDYV